MVEGCGRHSRKFPARRKSVIRYPKSTQLLLILVAAMSVAAVSPDAITWLAGGPFRELTIRRAIAEKQRKTRRTWDARVARAESKDPDPLLVVGYARWTPSEREALPAGLA